MRRKLKICSPQLGLDPKSDLGGEVHDHFVIKHLAESGHKIYVYLPKGRKYHKHKNIIVKRVPIKHIPAILFNLIVIPYLFRTYKKEKFDILRVHNPYFVGIGAIFFKLFYPKVPIITTHHLVERGFLFNLINKLTIKRYDSSIAVSEYVKSWLKRTYKLEENKVEVIYNGVEKNLKYYKKDKNLVKKYNFNNKVVLLFMGLLTERKDPIFVLKIYKKLQKKYNNIALLICGEGHLRKKIERYIELNELKNVVLAGRVKDKCRYINLADIFVLPSKNEGFGLVVGEAMACNKPVVITNAWSAKEAVTNGVEGYLAKQNNTKDWEYKIKKLISSKKLREKMGKNGIKKVKNKFSWHKVVPMHEKLYFKVLKSK